ncbi:MAG: cell wall-binding repeat-containing protein, partial [Acidimicrobiales bacterium]
AGMLGLAAGTSGAAQSTNNSIAATSRPRITSTGANEAAGDLTVTLHNTTGAALATSHLSLALVASGGGTVDWSSQTVTASGATKATAGADGTSTLTIAVSMPSGGTATVSVKGITYDTALAHGTVRVTPSWKSGTTSDGTFASPGDAVNAYATHSTPPARPSAAVLAGSTPAIAFTGTAQAAGTWMITLTGAKTSGWVKTETVRVTVAKHDSHNCTVSSSGYVLFTGTPSAAVSGSTGVSVAPTIAASTTNGATCTGLSHSELVLTFTNTGTFSKATGTVTIHVTGVKYDTKAGDAASAGTVSVASGVDAPGTTTVTGKATTKDAGAHGAANATFVSALVTANTPPTTVKPDTVGSKISPINVVEESGGAIPAGYVCVSLSTGTFDTTAKAKAAVTRGNGTVTPSVVYEKTATATSTKSVTTTTAAFARLKVTGASSSGSPSTYSAETLAVKAGSASGAVTALVKYGATPNCKKDTSEVGGSLTSSKAVAFSTSGTANQIYGKTADATAAKELEYQFPATGPTKCPGTGKSSTGTGERSVLLANDTHFPDALSGAYLASSLHTGILLTPYGKVSPVTATALRLEGITHVYVLGGTLAITNAVVTQLTSTTAYECGGVGIRHSSSGAVRKIDVTRIGGKTQYDTSQLIGTFVAKNNVGTGQFAGAYAGVNATGGNGKYNDTKGSGSTAPTGTAAMKTAIVATGTHFQDAMSASAMSYKQHFPVLLTTTLKLSTQVVTAIGTLSVTQVIVMGGPLAVTNSVVTSLESHGVSVLRIAGTDATDTAAELAQFELNVTATHTLLGGGLGLGWNPHGTLAVARGNGFTDALAGSVVTGNNEWPQLLTENQTTIGPYLTALLKSAGAQGPGIDHTSALSAGVHITKLVIFGGPLAVTPQVITKMQSDLS